MKSIILKKKNLSFFQTQIGIAHSFILSLDLERAPQNSKTFLHFLNYCGGNAGSTGVGNSPTWLASCWPHYQDHQQPNICNMPRPDPPTKERKKRPQPEVQASLIYWLQVNYFLPQHSLCLEQTISWSSQAFLLTLSPQGYQARNRLLCFCFLVLGILGGGGGLLFHLTLFFCFLCCTTP